MPKHCYNLQMRGGVRGNYSDDSLDIQNDSLFEHREREVRMGGDTLMAGIKPRITFKQQPRVGINRRLDHTIQNCLDDDLRMSINNNNNDLYARQVHMKGRGRGHFNGRLGTLPYMDMRNKLTQVVLADSNWYKVIIPCGANYSKDFIFHKILEHIAPETFVPIMYQHQDRSSIFYVDNSKTAKKLLSCDNKVYLSDKFRLHVYVKPGYPQYKIDDALTPKIIQAVIRRYNPETNALNLSRFHQDQDLAENYFCALFQPFVLTMVLDIATQQVPNLQALNLEGNKFSLIDRLSTLKTKFKNLKILYLGDNLLKDICLIDPIKNLQLEELRLSGNPFCSDYSMRQNEYVSHVRQKFPKLLRLDAIELPPPISFDVVEEDLKIPTSKKMFSVNPEVKEIASQFLQQYFFIFDNENRQQLMNAYHQNAVFSMTVSPSLGARPNSYLGESRNLLRLNDPNRRRKMLKRGRLAVVSTISEFPRTKHVWESFTMDVSLCSACMMLVTVTGLFKETNDSEAPFRYFNRTFIIVPAGAGYCILNEQLCIYNATQLQQKRAMNHLMTEEVTMSIPEPTMYYQNGNGVTTEDIKQKMVKELSQETNMNIVWSLKCLNEVQWNYESALSAFQQFFKQGLIPAEAFEKSI